MVLGEVAVVTVGIVCTQGMVKYASLIPRESIVDVEGVVAVAPGPVESCTQSEVSNTLLKHYVNILGD